MGGAPKANLWHSWLPAVVPASARRVRAGTTAFAATLGHAGAELVDRDPDVELGPARTVRGDAALAAVPVDAPAAQSPLKVARAAARIARAGRVRAQAELVERRLRRSYPLAHALAWEPGLLVRRLDAPPPEQRLLARFPTRAVVVGARDEVETVAAAALAAAGVEANAPLLAKGGATIAFGAETVVRVAIGPAADKLARQHDVLAALRERGAPTVVPEARGRGRCGLGEWAAEERLRGENPHDGLGPGLAEQCVDFLVELFALGREAEAEPPSAHAEAVSAASPAHAQAVRALGRRLDAELAGLPRGFAHGDFGLPNLFVRDGRLAGVADWEAAGDGRLPLLDLLHLLVENRLAEREQLGQGVVRHLLPLLAGGGGPLVADYLRRVGLDLGRRELESLAYAYWLEIVSYALVKYDRGARRQRTWLRDNVDVVVRTLHA